MLVCSVTGPIRAELTYRVSYPPVEAAGNAVLDHVVQLNDFGHIAWTESSVIGNYQQETSFAIYRPSRDHGSILVQRFSAPLTPRRGQFHVYSFTNSGGFFTEEIAPGKDTVSIWNGSSFTPIQHPAGPTDLGDLLVPVTLTEGGVLFGRVLPADSSDSEEYSGVYRWSSSGAPTKLYDDLEEIALGPNALGSTLAYRRSGSRSKLSYFRGGGVEAFPHPESSDFRLNDKDQVIGRSNEDGELWIYLPAADYGLPEGLTMLGRHSFGNHRINERGQIFMTEPGTGLLRWEKGTWEAIRIFDPNAPDSTVGFAGLLDISNTGDILARATTAFGTKIIQLKENELEITLTVDKSSVSVGEDFTLQVSVRNNTEETISGVGLRASSIFLTGDLIADWVGAPAVGLVLAPGESGTLDYVFRATAEGEVRIWGLIDAAGQSSGRMYSTESMGGPEVCVGCSEVVLEMEVDGDNLEVGDTAVVTVVVKSFSDKTFLVTFDQPLLLADVEDVVLVDEEIRVEPFRLDSDNPSREIRVPVFATGRGLVTLIAPATAVDGEGNETGLMGQVEITVRPLVTEIVITPRETVLNLTPDKKKTAKCLDYEANRAPGAKWSDCIEIVATITNESEQTVVDVEVPGADDVLGMISSLDLENPGVPLVMLGLETSSGVDPATQEPIPLSAPATLEPGESIVYTWYVGAFDAPVPLEIEVLSLGGINDRQVRGYGEETFKLIDEVVLKWGIKPKDGRRVFISGQTPRVQGFIENVTKEAGDERELLVLVYQTYDGNLGGGFMIADQASGPSQAGGPDTYTFFSLPADGAGSRKSLSSFFRSMPTYKNSEGHIEYGVRVWVVEEDDSLTDASDQALAEDEDGWLNEFDVTFAANPPPETDIQSCITLGIPPWLCGMRDGLIFDAYEGAEGLLTFAWSGMVELENLGVLVANQTVWSMVKMWKVIHGDEAALAALIQELYVEYRTYVELGVMLGEGGSKIPMSLAAFTQAAVTSFSEFMFKMETGTMEERQVAVGRFFGANPDMLLEPLVALRSWAAMRKSLKNAGADIADNALYAAQRNDADRIARSMDSRVDDAFSKGTDPAKALRAGDRPDPSMLRRIYGIGSEQVRLLQKIAQDMGVVLTFRSRSPLSLKMLKDKIAWPKPQQLKLKTVNQIDIDFLGYRSNAKARIEIVEPPPGLTGKTGKARAEALDAYMDALVQKRPKLKDNGVLRGEVRDRLRLRVEEWDKLVPDLDLKSAPSTSTIDVNFDAGAQGFSKDVGRAEGFKDTRTVSQNPIDSVDDIVTGQPQRRWEIKMTGPNNGDSRWITGDIDFLAFLEPNGMMILDETRRLKIYNAVAAALDMQHGESFTFLLQKARAEHLRCCTPGGEAMIAIGPNKMQTPTAAFFVDNASAMRNGPNDRFLGKRPKQVGTDGKIVYKKGEPVEIRRADPSGEYILMDGLGLVDNVDKHFFNRFIPRVYEEAIAGFIKRFPFYFPTYIERLLRASAEPESSGMRISSAYAQAEPVISVTFQAGGPVLQVTRDGETSGLRVWTETSGWEPVTASEAIALGEPLIADMAPVTSLPLGAHPGDRLLEITSQETLGTTGRFFEAGDRIVASPGESNQEFAVIIAMDPLTLSGPMIFEHHEGEMIALVETGAVDTDGDNLTNAQEVTLGTDIGKADTDGDGLSDSQELAYGTDPLDPGSGFQFVDLDASNDSTMTATWQAIAGKTYLLEQSLNLRDWFELGLVTAAEDGLESITFDQDGGREFPRFYRVRLDD